MMARSIRGFWAGSLALAFVAGVALPAWAQNGTLTGRVIDVDRRTTDKDGKPIAGKMRDQTGMSKDPADRVIGLNEATVTLELKGEQPRKFQTITDAYGEWYKSGLPPGTYDISVKREWRDPVPGRTTKLVVFTAETLGVVLKPGEKARAPEMSALTEEARAARAQPGAAGAPGSAAAAAGGANEDWAAAIALADAGKVDEAVAKLEALAAKNDKIENKVACYVKIGELQLGAKDEKAAEAAFLKAIEINPTSPDPYNQLASIYNGQRRFEEAAKMATKANELMGGTVGGSDPVAVFNQGIILWNASKPEEAKAQFAQAVKLNPKMAKAQYWLGMATFSLASSGKGNLIDAKAPFEEYLKLEPTGEFAETAKALLAAIK